MIDRQKHLKTDRQHDYSLTRERSKRMCMCVCVGSVCMCMCTCRVCACVIRVLQCMHAQKKSRYPDIMIFLLKLCVVSRMSKSMFFYYTAWENV